MAYVYFHTQRKLEQLNSEQEVLCLLNDRNLMETYIVYFYIFRGANILWQFVTIKNEIDRANERTENASPEITYTLWQPKDEKKKTINPVL